MILDAHEMAIMYLRLTGGNLSDALNALRMEMDRDPKNCVLKEAFDLIKAWVNTSPQPQFVFPEPAQSITGG